MCINEEHTFFCAKFPQNNATLFITDMKSFEFGIVKANVEKLV